jgi:hypothetical protein
MIVAIDASGTVTLEEPDNFRGFKVTSAIADRERLAKALTPAGRYDGEHAWISKDWLIANGGTNAAWRDGFDKMIGFAQSRGWIEGNAIRAHVEMAG